MNPLEDLSLQELRTRTSRKWQTYPEDVLPLWIAEMDVRLADPIASALQDAISRGDVGYPVGHEYARAVRQYAAEHWRRDIDVEATSTVPDVMRGMVAILEQLTDAGDALIVTSPVYPPFYAFPRIAHRRVAEAPLTADYRFDFDAIEATFERETAGGRRAAMLISKPHNPTGTVHTRAELTQLAALSNRYNVPVISDEIHAPLVLAGAGFTPYLTVTGALRGFSLISASKGWNLAGVKAALLIAGDDARADLAKLPPENNIGPSHLGVIAHVAAFREEGTSG